MRWCGKNKRERKLGGKEQQKKAKSTKHMSHMKKMKVQKKNSKKEIEKEKRRKRERERENERVRERKKGRKKRESKGEGEAHLLRFLLHHLHDLLSFRSVDDSDFTRFVLKGNSVELVSRCEHFISESGRNELSLGAHS